MTRRMAALLTLAGSGRMAEACKYVLPVHRTGPNFRVVVEDRGSPVEGVTIELSPGLFRAVTDNQGVAYFRKVPPGRYWIAPNPHTALQSRAELDVGTEMAGHPDVRIKWPAGEVRRARAMKGNIHVPDYIGDRTWRFLLELREARTGRVLRTATIACSSAFDFPGVTAGLYFLRLYSTGFRYDGQTAVEVHPGAPKPAFDIYTQWTSCGMFFGDREGFDIL